MKPARVFAIARKQFLSIRHDPRSLALMLIAPVMAMLIFGFAFGNEPKHIKVTIVNLDRGSIANTLITAIDHDKLNISLSTDTEVAKQDVRDGKKVAAIIFPENFSASVSEHRNAVNVNVFLDTTNQQISGAVVPTIMTAAHSIVSDGNSASVSITTSYAFPQAKDARYIDYFVPGVMAFAATLFTTLLTLLAFVGERTSGTLDRLRVTPATEAEIVIGYELAFGVIATIQGLLLLTVAVLVYHILIVGSLALTALLVVLTTIDAQAIGILISAAAKREGQAIQFLPFIVLPVFLLSGIFAPVATLPNWLRPFSYILPPTWSIDGLRDVLLRGWGLSHVWLHVVILAGFAVVFSVLAIFSLKRSKQ